MSEQVSKSKLEPHFAETMRLLQEVDASGMSLAENIEKAEKAAEKAKCKVESLKGLRDLKGIVSLPRKPRKDRGQPRKKGNGNGQSDPAGGPASEPPAFAEEAAGTTEG